MNKRSQTRRHFRASTAAVAFALLLGCGGGGDGVSPTTEQPQSVQLRETATVLSVTTEMPASSGHRSFEARAMNFAFEAKVDGGPLIAGRLELKGEREDDGVIEVEGRLFPDVDPSLPTPSDLKNTFDNDRRALQSAMREDIKVLGEELRAAIAAGTPHQDALAAFKAKFEQRMAKFRADVSALVADFRATRRARGGDDDDDDNAAKGFEVHGTIAADGSVDATIDLGAAGQIHVTGKLSSDTGSASGEFTGPASGDKGTWTAKANAGTPPPSPPPSNGGNAVAGLAKYNAMCAGCHAAGQVDKTSVGEAGDLAKDIDDIVSDLGRIDSAMKGLTLSAQDILDLKAFLRQANNPSTTPTPTPPPPPTTGNCASQDVPWSQGTSSCNASYAGGASGTSAALSDVVGPTTGTATASCTNGALTVTAPVCSTAATPPPPPDPAPCASQDVTWSQGASSCNASYAGGASGTSAALSDVVGPTTGTATATCTNGAVSVSQAVCATTPTGNFANGQALFGPPGNLCAGCHKAGTTFTTGPFSNLKGQENKIIANIGSLNGAMSTIRNLTAQEVLDLKVFLSQVP
jgi:mono/diheme cytochrome c family protein